MNAQTLTHETTNSESVDVFGFWMYIMTDCILFGSLFAAFAVLHSNTFGGPTLKQLVSLPYVFGESMFLLLSNLTYGFALLRLYNNKKQKMVFWLVLSIILGAGFLGMELYEFADLVREGHSWTSSAGMSSFFTLVGTHGLHVFCGLLWMIILTIQTATFGTNSHMKRRFTYLGLFWNFLDIVWIFVFTIVYLMGAI
ncbi:MAG: cytochrome o ubiquinol oxidase subunit III [Coxiellaceae bacterium]|nr:cytochrome o ubiquinol oxidase subunit III [Coxiellaceae bacterium]